MLAITLDDWRYLRGQLLADLPTKPVSSVREGRLEATYGVVVDVVGINGRRAMIVALIAVAGALAVHAL